MLVVHSDEQRQDVLATDCPCGRSSLGSELVARDLDQVTPDLTYTPHDPNVEYYDRVGAVLTPSLLVIFDALAGDVRKHGFDIKAMLARVQEQTRKYALFAFRAAEQGDFEGVLDFARNAQEHARIALVITVVLGLEAQDKVYNFLWVSGHMTHEREAETHLDGIAKGATADGG